MGILKLITEEVKPLPIVPKPQLSYLSQVVLGSPSNECRGVGICKIYMSAKAIPNDNTTIFAWLSRQDNGRLRMSFKTAGMSQYCLKKHFSWHLFQVIEAFRLPGWIQRKLQLTQVEVTPGYYVVWESAEMLIVDF